MRNRKNNHEIDTGTFADISFLLLIFFMVVTTFHKSYQIEMALPPKKENTRPAKISKARVLNIYLNESSQILVGETVQNKANFNIVSELERITSHPKGGLLKIHMLPTTKYQDYIQLLSNIKKSKSLLRDEISTRTYQRKYALLDQEEKIKITNRTRYSITEIETKL